MNEPHRIKCILCRVRWAVALHEEPPRSLNPEWADHPENQYHLCNTCHIKVQDMPRSEAAELLSKVTVTSGQRTPGEGGEGASQEEEQSPHQRV